jgi:aquaporin NIP
MKKYVAELIGTFTLVFCGTGAIVINQQAAGIVTHVGISLTFGLVVMSMIYTFGDISGAHLNPAVSVAFAAAGRLAPRLLPGYMISQLAGALSASFALKFLFPASELLGATIPAGADMQSFILELILTFFLMLVILSVATGSKEQGMFAGVAVGAVVALEALFAGPICGASMNPDRSAAPAMVTGHYGHLWVYLTAPFVGALLAVPLRLFLAKNPE